jgi:hypothetical protein
MFCYSLATLFEEGGVFIFNGTRASCLCWIVGLLCLRLWDLNTGVEGIECVLLVSARLCIESRGCFRRLCDLDVLGKSGNYYY